MSPWLIYWWSQADVLRDTLGVFSFFVGVIIGGVAGFLNGLSIGRRR